jgi:mannose-1-phosphate guanylyltransferase
MQALILAGGEGTRLRPLTSTIPKPVVPLAGRPFIVYMLEWLRSHGVDEVILACGFMAHDVRAVLGDGAEVGLRLLYVQEPRPLGTGGALMFAQDLLRERFLMLNGDILTDIDLGAQLAQHEATGARATLGLVEVADPSAYGLVRLAESRAVKAFLEKPGQLTREASEDGAAGRNLINAGVYVLERGVLEVVPAKGTASSIERDVFPRLVGQGLFGHPANGYWLDIGTPERYLRGTFDLLDGTVGSAERASGARGQEHTVLPALIGPGATIAQGAVVGPYAVLGPGVAVGERSRIERAVILEHATVGPGASISDAIVGPRARVGGNCRLERDVVLGAGAVVEAGSVVAGGARIFPGEVVSEGAISP